MFDAGYLVVPVVVLGAVIGSFLNVVIFRLPLDLSISKPRWSFCPHCEERIRPYDNIPILSWLILRGRCRRCAAPISSVYPLVECLTALLFVMVLDALYVGARIPPIGASPGPDAPILFAWLVLFGAMLATAVMDLESYSIDIRISMLAMGVGVASHAVWWGLSAGSGAAGPPLAGALPPALAAIAAAMGLVWLALHLLWLRRRNGDPSESIDAPVESAEASENGTTQQPLPAGDASRSQPSTEPPQGASDDGEADEHPPTPYRTSDENAGFKPWAMIALVIAIVGLAAWQALEPHETASAKLSIVPAAGQRGFAGVFLLMLVLILASMQHREADDQIIEEIEAERHGARGVAIREFLCLVPSLLVGLALVGLMQRQDLLHESGWQGLVGFSAPFLEGAVSAVAGMVLAAGMGWGVRILGTLAFGKEALGTGDIYILAAIGAVGGVWLAVFGFFIGAILALIGVVATIFHKRSRAIPFGPWIALGALVALFAYPPLLGSFSPVAVFIWSAL